MSDRYNLQRFVDAQADVYDDARRQLRGGRKTTHWMWFIFPQLKGLGRTRNADYFGIASLAEARSYLAHPLLGPRLRECAALLRDYPGSQPITLILGPTDARKLRSAMTLFLAAGNAEDRAVFQAILDRYYRGEPDELTLGMLSEG